MTQQFHHQSNMDEKLFWLCYSVSQVFGDSFTDRNLPDAQSNLGVWGDGRGEDELSPEEIQMVCLSCV